MRAGDGRRLPVTLVMCKQVSQTLSLSLVLTPLAPVKVASKSSPPILGPQGLAV